MTLVEARDSGRPQRIAPIPGGGWDIGDSGSGTQSGTVAELGR